MIIIWCLLCIMFLTVVSLGFSDDNTINIISGELQPDVLITLLLLTTIWEGMCVIEVVKCICRSLCHLVNHI